MKKLLIFVLVIFISGCGSEINGSSDIKWRSSIMEIAKENHKLDEQLLFMEALGRMLMLSYAENNPNFNKMEYQNMGKNNFEEIRMGFASNPVVMMDVMKKTDGMDFDDVIDAGNDANEELNKILSERPVTVAIAPIPSQPEIIKSAPVETASAPIESSPLSASVEQPTKNLQAPADNSQTQQEKNELARYKAKDALDEATKQIDVVWNAATQKIRDAILPEQEEWLKNRENDCELKASSEEPNNSVLQETIKLRCITTMTNQRTEILKQEIASLQRFDNNAQTSAQVEPVSVDKPVENKNLATKTESSLLSAKVEQHIQKMLKDAINNDESSIQASKQYLENQPKPAKGDKTAARKINEEALKLIQSQQYVQALPLLAKATQIDTSDVEILNNYGFVLMKSRDLDKALSILTNTLTIKPDRASAWANLADVLALQGHVDLATGGYMNVYRFSGNREKTYKNLQNPQLHEDSPYVREALANAIQKITR
jgi:tetratricopeptide (TPR) repeat protein